MRILLVANYVPDRQHSMLGFANLLEQGLRQAGNEVNVLHPPVFFGRVGALAPRAFKWFAYLDKLLLGPSLVKRAAENFDVVHICDHSNAVYIPKSSAVPYVVTCHDLLAVRGSLGEDTDCPASPLGKLLQQWILRGLRCADRVACASTATLTDLQRLVPEQRCAEVLPLALRYDLLPITKGESEQRLKQVAGLDPTVPFVLHVGSSHARKNREGILRIFSGLLEQMNVQLVLAGKPLTSTQRALATSLGLNNRIIEAGPVSNDLLAALYGNALAFLFPSRFEGFGWPIVEAQSCGCPVLCSNRPPFPEVAGDGALTRAVEDEQGFADDILKLARNAAFRSDLIQRGLSNAERYKPESMISKYISLYDRVLTTRQREALMQPARA